MLLRLAYRFLTRVSPRLAWKAAYLWAWKGLRAMRAYRRRVRRGELFPPFLFFALTDACNLRCRGCWIGNENCQSRELTREQVDQMIKIGRHHGSYFYTLLGGEPMLYGDIWSIVERHRDCYFQIISNGLFFDDAAADRIRRLGNVTPLVSIDGPEEINDQRRGQGVFREAMAGLDRLRERKILYGVATTLTTANLASALTDEYVEQFVDRGAMYLWYYGFRPVGADPSPELCMTQEQMLYFRRRLLELRRKHPIILIDTYWDAQGQAVCPAAKGLGFHIGPSGDIDPCPPLSFACETIDDHDGDLFRTINESTFLRSFQDFVNERTRGCVILEQPDELAEFLRRSGVKDYSGRDALAELAASQRRMSHHIPGGEQPEDSWLYRFLKKSLFFGMGGYG